MANSKVNIISDAELKTYIDDRISNSNVRVTRVTNKQIDFDVNPSSKNVESYYLNISYHHSHNSILKKLVFDSCIFNGSIQMNNKGSIASIGFENCQFNSVVSTNMYEKDMFTKECVFNDLLKIVVDSNNSSIEISELNFNKDLEITGTNQTTSIKNLNNVIPLNDQRLIIKCGCSKLYLSNINSKEIVFEGLAQVKQNLIFKNEKFQNITFNKLSINDTIIFDEVNLNTLKIETILGNHPKLVVKNKSHFESLNIPLEQLSKINIEESNVDKLLITGVFKSEKILNFQKVNISELSFENVQNEAGITLTQIGLSPGGLLSIKASNLGRTDFINCDFDNAVLDFENSKLTNVFLAETKFPKKVTTNGKINFLQAQLAFGQLNNACQGQGDTIQSLEFQSREIEAHYHVLKANIKKFPFLTWDLINLWLNKQSNDFGRSWGKGILFTFIVGIIFFYFLIISTNQYTFGLHFNFTWDLIQPFFKFMNPIRFFDLSDLFKNKQNYIWLTVTNVSYFIDFFGRILIAYGYYQTIQAFRRFGRR